MTSTNRVKYKFTGETKRNGDGVLLHRIQRVSSGELGGWIESTENLSISTEDDAWVADDAEVYWGATVNRFARVEGNAKVKGGSFVTDNVLICGSAEVDDNSVLGGCVIVKDDALVCGAMIRGEGYGVIIGDNAVLNAVGGMVAIDGAVIVKGDAKVSGNVILVNGGSTTKNLTPLTIDGNAYVEGGGDGGGNCLIEGRVHLTDSARVMGNVVLRGAVDVLGETTIDGHGIFVDLRAWWDGPSNGGSYTRSVVRNAKIGSNVRIIGAADIERENLEDRPLSNFKYIANAPELPNENVKL